MVLSGGNVRVKLLYQAVRENRGYVKPESFRAVTDERSNT